MGGWSKEVERHSVLNRSHQRSFLEVKRPNSEILPLFAVSSAVISIIKYRKDSRTLKGSKPLPQFVGDILKRFFGGGRKASTNRPTTTKNNSNPRKMAGEAAAARAQGSNHSSSNTNQKKKNKKKNKKKR